MTFNNQEIFENKMISSDQKMISDNQERIENKIISANRESVKTLDFWLSRSK